jgi:hypothetical protein
MATIKEAIAKVISVIELDNKYDGVHRTVRALWKDFGLNPGDLETLAMGGLTERVIRVRRYQGKKVVQQLTEQGVPGATKKKRKTRRKK